MDQPVPGGAHAAHVIDSLLREGVEAAEAGFDSVVVPERHMRPDCYVPDSLTLLTLLASHTSDVRLGTYASVLTLHQPLQFAERVALIDLLSRGRVFVTLARGFDPRYWRLMGIPEDRVNAYFRESVEVVKRAWAGERFSFEGTALSFEDVFLSPLPFQRPAGPPIWGGAHFPAAVCRAGEWADAWAGGFFPIDRDEWEPKVAAYREVSQAHGKPSFVATIRAGFVSETRAKAEESFGEHVVDELRYYFNHAGSVAPLSIRPDFTLADLRPHLVLGSPDDCIKALRWYEDELGIDYIVMRFRMPTGPSIDESIAAVRLFGREVLPVVHDTPVVHPALPGGPG